jgi:hypothetical protein
MLSVEEALRGIPRSLGNTIGCDAGLANGVAGVTSHQVMALPVDDELHRRSIPDACISGCSLPVCAEVKNAPLVVANNLHIEGIRHLAIPEVLLDSVYWNPTRSLLKLYNDSVYAKGKARQTEFVLKEARSDSTFLVSWHADELILERTDGIHDPPHCTPSRLLTDPPTQAGNASEMATAQETQANTDLLDPSERASTVVDVLQAVQEPGQSPHSRLVEPGSKWIMDPGWNKFGPRIRECFFPDPGSKTLPMISNNIKIRTYD